MENASKALIMAGGVLISILIIAVLVRVFSTVSSFKQAELTQKEQEQLVAFNEQYTKYAGQYVYGTEVITVINRALNNTSHKITVSIKFANEYPYKKKEWNSITRKYEEKEIIIKSGKELKITNEEGIVNISEAINNPSKEDDSLASRAFKCTNIGYDSYGRVNSITFEEKQWGALW